jgi:hypothetical protein
LLIGPQLYLASASDRLANKPQEFRNLLVCPDQFWVQSLSPGKSEKLRRQCCSPISGTPRGSGELPDLAIICRIFDQLEVSGDYRKQVVELVRNAARELADGLHSLALLKLFFGQAARLHGVLVLGDVPEEDGEAFAGGERIERVPGTAARAERLVCGHFENDSISALRTTRFRFENDSISDPSDTTNEFRPDFFGYF